MKRNDNLDKLIEEIIKSGNFDEFMEKLEKEGIEIDLNVKITPSKFQFKGKELYDVDINDKQYEISLEEYVLENKNFIEINFRLKNYKELKNSPSNRAIETGITNTGDSKEVFNKIVSAFVILLKKKNPNYITFQAREEKRQKLYNYIIIQTLRKIGGYKKINTSPIINDIVDSDEFWLEKTQ